MNQSDIDNRAQRIIGLIHDDMIAGLIHDDSPIDELEYFTDLHEFVDANEYVIQVMRGLELDAAEELRAANRITNAVDQLLRANPIPLDIQSVTQLTKGRKQMMIGETEAAQWAFRASDISHGTHKEFRNDMPLLTAMIRAAQFVNADPDAVQSQGLAPEPDSVRIRWRASDPTVVNFADGSRLTFVWAEDGFCSALLVDADGLEPVQIG